MKNSNDKFGNRTRALPVCSTVPQPTLPPRAPSNTPGADKSLARPGRKQARKHVRRYAQFQHRDASCHQVLLPARQGAEGNSRHSDRNISLFTSWSG